MLDQKKTVNTSVFNAGDAAPFNEKASNSIDQDFCFACGRKLGKNAFHFEVNTSWELIELGGSDSQGCFPVGSECAKKFAAGLLVRIGA
jgi:hypothetical protein